MKRLGLVTEDGVHMTEDMCRSSAVNMCFRVAEAHVMMVGEKGTKRRRLF